MLYLKNGRLFVVLNENWSKLRNIFYNFVYAVLLHKAGLTNSVPSKYERICVFPHKKFTRLA